MKEQNSLIERGARWLRAPRRQRAEQLVRKLKLASAVPFYFGKANLLSVFMAYHPDSQTTFKNHPEFDVLFNAFTAKNRFNNAGDVTRLWSFILNVKQVLSENIEGEFAELGVWRGNTAAVLAYFASRSGRKAYLFDTYEGFDTRDLVGVDATKPAAFADTSLTLVKSVIGESSEACSFVKGYFPDSVTDVHRRMQYAIVSLDCDLYDPMKAGLNFFYPRMPKGGLLLLHDYSSLHWEGAKNAIDEFCKANQEYVVLMPDKSGSAFIRKSKERGSGERA